MVLEREAMVFHHPRDNTVDNWNSTSANRLQSRHTIRSSWCPSLCVFTRPVCWFWPWRDGSFPSPVRVLWIRCWIRSDVGIDPPIAQFLPSRWDYRDDARVATGHSDRDYFSLGRRWCLYKLQRQESRVNTQGPVAKKKKITYQTTPNISPSSIFSLQRRRCAAGNAHRVVRQLSNRIVAIVSSQQSGAGRRLSHRASDKMRPFALSTAILNSFFFLPTPWAI